MSVSVRGFVDIIVRSFQPHGFLLLCKPLVWQLFLGGGGVSQRNVGIVLEGEPSAASETCHLSSTSMQATAAGPIRWREGYIENPPTSDSIDIWFFLILSITRDRVHPVYLSF